MQLNNADNSAYDKLASGLFGSDAFSFDAFLNADENVQSSISSLLNSFKSDIELDISNKSAVIEAPRKSNLRPTLPAAPYFDLPAVNPVSVVIEGRGQKPPTSINLKTVEAESIIAPAQTASPITYPRALTPQPIPAPNPEPMLRPEPRVVQTIIPELAALSEAGLQPEQVVPPVSTSPRVPAPAPIPVFEPLPSPVNILASEELEAKTPPLKMAPVSVVILEKADEEEPTPEPESELTPEPEPEPMSEPEPEPELTPEPAPEPEPEPTLEPEPTPEPEPEAEPKPEPMPEPALTAKAGLSKLFRRPPPPPISAPKLLEPIKIPAPAVPVPVPIPEA